MLAEYIQKLILDGYRVAFDSGPGTGGIQITLYKNDFRVQNIVPPIELNPKISTLEDVLMFAIQNMEKQFS